MQIGPRGTRRTIAFRNTARAPIDLPSLPRECREITIEIFFFQKKMKATHPIGGVTDHTSIARPLQFRRACPLHVCPPDAHEKEKRGSSLALCVWETFLHALWCTMRRIVDLQLPIVPQRFLSYSPGTCAIVRSPGLDTVSAKPQKTSSHGAPLVRRMIAFRSAKIEGCCSRLPRLALLMKKRGPVAKGNGP